MKRQELLETLELAKAALAANALIPVYQSFVFDNDEVYAYNDRIGICLPCKLGITAGLDGQTILGLLHNSNADKIVIETEENEVLVQLGITRSRLPYFKQDEFFFEEPNPKSWDVFLELPPEVLKGLQHCLVTVSHDTALPALMGVTLTQTKGLGLALYSCDGDALSRYTIGVEKGVKLSRSYTMPTEFCELLLKMYETLGSPKTELAVDSDWAGGFVDEDNRAYGRIIEPDDPFDHEANIQKTIGDDPEYIAVPKGLEQALSRATVVVDRETMKTNLKIEKGKIKLHTESSRGVVRDSFDLEGDHADVDVMVNPELVMRALTICTEMSVQENCTVYRAGDEFLQLVGNLES